MTPMPDLNKLAQAIHEENMKWWVDLETGEPIKTPTGQKEMLMISEVAEAMEGLRKDLMDDKLPHRKMVEVEIADYVIRVLDYSCAHKLMLTVEVPDQDDMKLNETQMMISMCAYAIQLSTEEYMWSHDGDHNNHTLMGVKASLCVAVACMFCEKFGYDLWAAVEEKRAYNRTRPDHKIENRMKDGGKKW